MELRECVKEEFSVPEGKSLDDFFAGKEFTTDVLGSTSKLYLPINGEDFVAVYDSSTRKIRIDYHNEESKGLSESFRADLMKYLGVNN